MTNGRKKSAKGPKRVEALKHGEAKRKNIPTAELQPLAERVEEMRPVRPAHFRRQTPLAKGETRPRDADLDPQIIWNGVRIRLTKEQIRALEEKGQVEIGDAQLVWRGKDTQDWSDLVVQVPPLYIQEKIHPKVIIDDLVRARAPLTPPSALRATPPASQGESQKAQGSSPASAGEGDHAKHGGGGNGGGEQINLFADFNGLDPEARTEFYQHDQYWSNRMILGDSLQVMASLAERESLRGKVQCIYIDPPYGIKFNSNWQVSTLSRDVKDGKLADVSREPEQVKAFRDTWKDGIHSYLTYLRDRLTVAKELLTDSGSIFVQIGDENVHRVRALMDEVFGEANYLASIVFRKTTGKGASTLDNTYDYALWYARDREHAKYRSLFFRRAATDDQNFRFIRDEAGNLVAPTSALSGGQARLNPIRVYPLDTGINRGLR